MIEKPKLSLKGKLLKSLQVKHKNLKKKLNNLNETYRTQKNVIEEELEVLDIQLRALQK